MEIIRFDDATEIFLREYLTTAQFKFGLGITSFYILIYEIYERVDIREDLLLIYLNFIDWITLRFYGCSRAMRNVLYTAMKLDIKYIMIYCAIISGRLKKYMSSIITIRENVLKYARRRRKLYLASMIFS